MYANISLSETGAASQPLSPLPRGSGEARLTIKKAGTHSHFAERYQQGTMKVRCPRIHTHSDAEAVLINLGGGLTGGDRVTITARAEAGAAGTLASQACEKIYRSLGTDAELSTTLTLEAGATLNWLNQPTILFEAGRVHRKTEVIMAADATFVGVEAMIFGRTAMGETVRTGSVRDTIRIRRAGRLIHAETFSAQGSVQGSAQGNLEALLARPAMLGPNKAMATIRYVAPDAEARRDELRETLKTCESEAAATAFDGMMFLRFAAPTGQALMSDLITTLTHLRGQPVPRVWTQ